MIVIPANQRWRISRRFIAKIAGKLCMEKENQIWPKENAVIVNATKVTHCRECTIAFARIKDFDYLFFCSPPLVFHLHFSQFNFEFFSSFAHKWKIKENSQAHQDYFIDFSLATTSAACSLCTMPLNVFFFFVPMVFNKL